MATPKKHADNSAKKYGGKAEDYLDIHQFMDSSKSSFSDARHRAITHNIWFCVHVIPKVFGEERTNSKGKKYSTKDIAEEHCYEDLGTVPTIQDYLENMTLEKWMKGESTVEKKDLNGESKIEKLIRELKPATRVVYSEDPMTRKLD